LPVCPDGYIDLGPISQGATATVRKVSRGATLFALKRLHPHLIGQPEAHSLFLDETMLGHKLDHPCLAKVVDYGADELGPYHLQEFIPGPTLASVLSVSPVLPLPVAARIAADIARGLGFAHGLNEGGGSLEVIHRDVNPSNVIVSVTGEARLIDFGVARFRGATSPLSAVRGTAAYFAPEQARGEPLDKGVDLFALGAVLYEMLSGMRAFSGPEHVALAKIGAGEMPKAPITATPAIATILRALLALHPKRAKEATHIAAALQAQATTHAEVLALLRRLARR
jgi:eukaryotic-like serine/threonine-protein kinase